MSAVSLLVSLLTRHTTAAFPPRRREREEENERKRKSFVSQEVF